MTAITAAKKEDGKRMEEGTTLPVVDFRDSYFSG
jgi:hypothetical protein